MRKVYIYLLCFFALTLVCGKVEAQSTIQIDPTFDIGTGFTNELSVRSVALQSDGKILAGGYYTKYNGQTQNRISRLNIDGSLDTSFEIGTGFNSYVVAITQQPDGKILTGGAFTSYNGQTRNRIARLNSDGSLDTSFNIGVGFSNSWVHKITLQSDGKILVGGSFTEYNGQAQNRIVRLNTDGSIDTSFVTGTGFNNEIWSITLQPDGKILVGGHFTSYNGQSRNSIVRLNTDGSLDTSFNIGTGFNISEWTHSVGAIILQADGKILIGGSFTEYNGQTQKSIVRLNTDGSVDTSFNSEVGFYRYHANGLIHTMALQPDGKILVGGTFTRFGTQTQGRISRLNSDGSLDTFFETGIGFNTGGVDSIILQPDGKILTGGHFAYYNGQSQRGLTRLYEDNCETPPTPQATLIPIICSFIPEDMGTLVVTYPLGDEYEYSIDGVIYQSSSVFPNAWPLGTFQLTVRQGDCISEPLKFSNIGQSTVPEAEIIQPDCSDVPESGQFGTISVTFPLGDEFQYSINGEDYQDSPFFNIVPPGSYELTFRLDEFCVSDPLEVIINDPVTSLTPIVDIAQPNCDNPYGSITIEPFSLPWIWAQPEYSINGTDYYTDNVFENLPSGTYYVTVKLGNCISESLEVNIHFPPSIPENPTVNVVQPTCENPFGSIEVTSPVDVGAEFIPNYEYSINGVDYYEFTLFDNLSSGIYYVTVRHLMSGCVSDSLEVILNAPDIPSPTVNIIQPACDSPYGSIEVTDPLNSINPELPPYQYSINGVDYQFSPFFTNLSPGIYQVTAQQGYCISDPLEVIINELPEIAVNLITICENENRFLLKAETEENYQYLWNTGETTPEIEIDGTGIYSVTVSLDDCSKDFSISIDAIPCRIPKGISPNGDFINDEFDLSGYGTVNTVEVFNRYGKIVYSQSNYTNQWKGQSNNGKELPTGTYYYKVVFQNGETKTGWVYLNRE